MSLARLQNKALAKQIGEVKAVSKLFQKHFAVAENISFASSCQRNFKIVLQYLDKENIFLSLELEIVSSILRGERNLLWMREATKVNEKLLTNNIFLQLANHVCFFWRFWGKTLQNNPTQQRKCVAKKNASPRHVCSEQNSIHFSEVQTYFNFESRRMSGVQEIQAATYLPTTLRELPIFKENFLNLIEAHILLLLSSLCKKVLFRNPVATRIFAHQLLNVSETPQENWIWTNDK